MKDNSLSKSYKTVTFIIILFFSTAIIGALLGKVIDEAFGIRPIGTIISLLIFYGISWIIISFSLKRFRAKILPKSETK